MGANSLLREDFVFPSQSEEQPDLGWTPRDSARTSSTHVPSVTATRWASRPRYVEDSVSCFCLEMS